MLLCYADHADHDGGSIWPAADLIAKKTGYTKRTVQRLTRELEDLGLMLPVGDKKGGRARTNQWTMPISGGLKGVSPVTLSKSKRVSPVTKRVSGRARKGDTALSPEPSVTVKETSITRPDGREPSNDRPPKAEQDRLRKVAENTFKKATGLDPPEPTNEKRRREAGELWWNPLRMIVEFSTWDDVKLRRMIEEAVFRMQENDLTISSPKSILNSARAIIGEENTGRYKDRRPSAGGSKEFLEELRRGD